jgi:hypothetical protein
MFSSRLLICKHRENQMHKNLSNAKLIILFKNPFLLHHFYITICHLKKNREINGTEAAFSILPLSFYQDFFVPGYRILLEA